VALERPGDSAFRPLKRATPWGARLKYELSPTLALAVGFQYLSGSQNSSVTLLATGRTAGGAAFTDRYENPGFGLWFREAREFKGPGTSTFRSLGSTAGETADEKAWDGTWQVMLFTSKTAWGTFNASKVVNNVPWDIHPRPRKFEF